jgi:hypothetical protein
MVFLSSIICDYIPNDSSSSNTFNPQNIRPSDFSSQANLGFDYNRRPCVNPIEAARVCTLAQKDYHKELHKVMNLFLDLSVFCFCGKKLIHRVLRDCFGESRHACQREALMSVACGMGGGTWRERARERERCLHSQSSL